jgi:hypothetical protein
LNASRQHPYRGQPDKAFWKRSVSACEEPVSLIGASLFAADDRVMSAGSCFASNLVPWLERVGIEYVRTELPHPALAHLPEDFGYREFSAAYGNMYTVRQFVQLLMRANGEFRPAVDRWVEGNRVIDPFRPGLRYPASSDGEFDALTHQHLACVLRAVEHATVLVFTLGLTEAWRSKIDGAVYPVAPGVIAGTFDPEKHEFINFSHGEVLGDLIELRAQLGSLNPALRIVLTVSPVPLVATATADHVLIASTYSKSVLRAAAGEAAATMDGVEYFPAYELVTGPQTGGRFFESDARSVTAEGIEAVMRVMLGAAPGAPLESPREIPFSTPASVRLSSLITDAECEEALLDDRP